MFNGNANFANPMDGILNDKLNEMVPEDFEKCGNDDLNCMEHLLSTVEGDIGCVQEGQEGSSECRDNAERY